MYIYTSVFKDFLFTSIPKDFIPTAKKLLELRTHETTSFQMCFHFQFN